MPAAHAGGQAKARSARPSIWHFPGYLAQARNLAHHAGGAIRAGDWKLIEFFEDGRLELYNLRDDLGERNNLASSQPERAKELQTRLAAWRQHVGAKMPTKNEAVAEADEAARTKKKGKKAGQGKGKGRKARAVNDD